MDALMGRGAARHTWLLAAGLAFFSCKKEEVQTETNGFALLSAERTGITFQNQLNDSLGIDILEYLYYYNGGGVAAGDIDGDGLVDLYFTGNQVPNRLYRNRGDFSFEDITESAGVDGDGAWSTGATMADVNGDGLLDIYVSQVAGLPGLSGQNKLYLNLGGGKFREAAAEFGIDFRGFGTHAVFFDYDRDGDLDLYLLNHNIKSPEVFVKSEARGKASPLGDRLLKNLAMEGQDRFLDVTEAAGIYSSILGFGLGVSVEDFDGDGWLDLYVSNDFTENDYLYLNQQDGTFREALGELIPSTSRYSMGNDASDLNGDGMPDIFTTDMLPEDPSIWMKSVGEDKAEVYQIKEQFGYQDQYVRNHLLLNQGGKGFAEIALAAGVSASDWSWSPLIFDMDNDGLPDIHVTNGIVKRPNNLDFIQYSQSPEPGLSPEELRKKQIDMLPSVKLSNFAWKNQGDLSFKNEASLLGLDQESYSNGSTYADLDNDGDLDLIVNNLNQPAFVYQNHAEKTGNQYLRIDLQTGNKNPQGIGAQVRLFSGQQSWAQRLSTSRGFQSGPSTTLVFGLGKTSSLDSILVSWPDGQAEIFPKTEANQSLQLIQGTGNPYYPAPKGDVADLPSFPISWSHHERNATDFVKREYLAPRSFSRMGPAMAVADVNGDGLDDIYLGGAMDQPGAFFLQKENGDFEQIPNPMFELLAKAEDVVAQFADLNGDGHLDLFVGSGGNEHASGELYNFDRVFFGNGRGQFAFAMRALPPIGENTSCVAIYDLDGDGDLDLFVGSSVTTGDYGASPKSSILINGGKGQFADETTAWLQPETALGMVNTAKWADLDGDGTKELLLSGDWQGLRVFGISPEKKLVERRPKGLEFSAGWIQSLEVADLDGNGKPDILVGNLGTNSKLKASTQKPVWLYHHDFDGNGQADPLIFHYLGDKLVPFATRDDLIRQLPGIKRKHSSYADYSQISRPEDLFSPEELEGVRKLPAYEFRSGAYLQQEDGSFAFVPFPEEAQRSPIFAIAVDEETGTLYLGGNSSDFRVDLGKSRNLGVQAYRWSQGSWQSMDGSAHVLPGLFGAEIRGLKILRTAKGNSVLGAQNNGPLRQIR
ncbi:VCBS repeat-containing protein [Algoriphagus sp. H41]|uniref:VCBS repeat-containing protein n=1 Tax=Algoriphagus oliviformis TaxID=2811231 RepID=A0ABS3C092_9BACT|nr:VCBS repeat-containing protein [Algoriphagus oliviformis]MBN7810330.1 VCBS repeat-containing protein [Algoriphagus oliviformis]